LLELLLINPIRLLFSARPWAAALFGLLSFAIGTFWFVMLVTLLAMGVGLAITFFGIPILLFTAWLWTWGARAERARVNLFFGTQIRSAYRETCEEPWPRRVRAFLTDPAIWRDLAYLFILFPVGIAELVIVTVAFTIPLHFITMPLWFLIAPHQHHDWGVTSMVDATGLALLGLPLVLLLPYVLVGMGALHTGLARVLLAPTREEALEQRVDELTVSRSRMMEAVLAERRRIERDLHDGAQQRLVALAMDLGMARIKLQSDPDIAWKLVDEAHREAKLAMVEIRNLVQGIHPAVLTDRGLDAAISALAGRSPVPVAVMVDLEERLPDTVESTAYFVVAETLTNIAKHSVATEAEVRIFRERGLLVIEVRDNGVGGADPATGSGLRGLADRVIALDGRLIVDSPRGGPTRIRAEIPCAS
jgi:signal transduction histidine kinase